MGRTIRGGATTESSTSEYVGGGGVGIGDEGMTTASDVKYLLPDTGVIMSTGDPDKFCTNDSDAESTNWGTGGDADLTSIAMLAASDAMTYDAVSVVWLQLLRYILSPLFQFALEDVPSTKPPDSSTISTLVNIISSSLFY